MGACNCASSQQKNTVLPSELDFQSFEEERGLNSRDHLAWVNGLQKSYTSGEQISESQIRLGSLAVDFDIEGFLARIDNSKDSVRTRLQDYNGKYWFYKLLAFTIPFSRGSCEDKAATFIKALRGEREDATVSKERVSNLVNFICDFTLQTMPYEAIQQARDNKQLQDYCWRLQRTRQPLQRYIIKVFFGTSEVIGYDYLKRVIVTSKEGQALMDSSKMRTLANSLSLMQIVANTD
jgi:hypothetical protein